VRPGLSSACSIPLPATRNPCIGIHSGYWGGCVYVVSRVCVCVFWQGQVKAKPSPTTCRVCVCVTVCRVCVRRMRCVCVCGVCVCGVECVYACSCVCRFSRLFFLRRDTKLGVLPADALTPLYRLASRRHPLAVGTLLMRSAIAPPLRGAVELWPRCPLMPLDLIVSRGVVTCVCVGVCRMWCLYV